MRQLILEPPCEARVPNRLVSGDYDEVTFGEDEGRLSVLFSDDCGLDWLGRFSPGAGMGNFGIRLSKYGPEGAFVAVNGSGYFVDVAKRKLTRPTLQTGLNDMVLFDKHKVIVGVTFDGIRFLSLDGAVESEESFALDEIVIEEVGPNTIQGRYNLYDPQPDGRETTTNRFSADVISRTVLR